MNMPAGPGVRVDTHLTLGAQISPYYDSLIAKIICYGERREDARLRMGEALAEFSLLGVQNTAAFLRDIITSEAFARGELSTRFIMEYFPHWHPDDALLERALIAAAMVAQGTLGVSRGIGASQAPDGATMTSAAMAQSPWAKLGTFELWSRR
jgi:acetyl/propionyl-CoA carboxylase alpha subunit